MPGGGGRTGRRRAAVLGLIAASVAAVAIVALSGDLNDPAVGLLSIGNDAKHAAHRSKIASAASRQAVKEEALINEAVSEAMTKVEEKTGQIVKHAVQTAVKKAVGQVKEGGEVAQKLMHGQQVDKAAIAEKAELSHISTELSKELGNVVDDAEQDHEKHTAKHTLTYAEVKEEDPNATKGQYRWLKWVQEQMSSLSSPDEQKAAAKDLLRLTNGKGGPESHPRRSRGRTVIQAKAIKGSDVGSVHNPKFVAAQHKRDEEAEKDLELLKHLKEARRHKAAAKPVKHGLKRFSTADINKELSILDKHEIVQHKLESAKEAAAKKARDSRDAQAEKYLEALKKKDPSAMQAKKAADKPVPVSSRKNPAYVDAQKMRDLEAKVDMKMLKKGAVIVEEHNQVKAIKLQPVVVHGDDKLAKEREMVEKAKEAAKAGSHERSLIADKDLKKLRQQPALGKPFHKVVVPKSVLDHRKSHMNEKAMRDLKALMSEEHAERANKERPRKRVNRNQLAQELFKNLEKKDGRITKVMPATITSADTLAQADLKDLGGKKDAAAKPQPAAKK